MPLAKYYCDYCDKQFQDTPSARKRHLQGVQHQRARALWYDSLRDPSLVQAEGYGKGVCNHFMRTGFCQFGDSCKYFHPKQNIQSPATNFKENVQLPYILGNQPVVGSSIPGVVIREGAGLSLGNLPPSLRPPPEGGYPPLPFVDWG
ncbi:PREDICTED: zinc finger CCCH domain-containing protein 3 isoform X2 [Nelumbo nucifera]|uniref:Zinc finger CCCH domain-containing protein 3 isoform X2 n=1 Tax=Nelumbo nucifera TaxID=4432 RepID=A0A1U8BHQ8_NELNU|nr:PREDICTED: zinc finger CCCH domain-containing protein 3 isoform X2 [Nelumbo nucifera]